MIEGRNLTKRFDGYAAVQDVSLAVARGERHAVIGPNGAGKTTLFNLFSGEILPDSGRIAVDGVDVTRQPPDRRSRLGVGRSFQRNSLFREFTVRENLAIACALARRRAGSFWSPLSGMKDVQERAEALSTYVGIAEDLGVEVAHLSYGSQRQLEISMALACEPKVLLLDEPTSGMSPEETRRIQGLIARLPRSMTVVVIEHDMDVVFSIADRVTVLDYGRILAQGSPQEIAASEAVRTRYLGQAVQPHVPPAVG